MNIWITEIGEPLPLERNVRLHRYGQFSQALASYGHDVIWWTSSFSHAPKIHVVDSSQDRQWNGLTLRFIKGPGYRRNISFARIQHQRHFANEFLRWAHDEPAPDLIISPVPTIEVAAAATRFGMAKGIPVIIDIRDLWPDELKDLAPKALRPLAKLALFRSYQRMHFVCRNASAIMGVSNSYLDYGLKFAGRQRTDKDCFFPLGYSMERLPPEQVSEAQKWCDQNQVGTDPNRFLICFFGTIGQYFDLDTVIASAKQLEHEFPVQFVIAGDGSKLAYYRKRAEDLKNIIFPGWLDAPKIAAVMSRARVGLAPYCADAKMSLPNKPFEYMAGGLPVVSSIQGELTHILRDNQCGVTYDARSAEMLTQIIRDLHANEPKRASMGLNARALLEREFATKKIFERVAHHLESVGNMRSHN